MPKLDRSEYYDLTRDMNWKLSYVTEEEAFPETQVAKCNIPLENWWGWDEPFKLSYREYVYNQSDKEASTYSIKSAIGRSKLFDDLDNGWKTTLTLHYGAVAFGEWLASIGEARMARFGLAASWRNTATFGCLDEQRHGQIQVYFPHGLIDKHPQFDFAHKAYHTENWAAIASKSQFDDMVVANDATSTALQMPFTFETGFTNLQFLGMATDALSVGDVEFGSLISSIQTDESRHAQIGEPTLRIMMENGQKEEAQKMVDLMWWRSWRLFAILTGLSMDYYTPLEHRTMSFKEFMEEWIMKQFLDMFTDFGMKKPWYWDIFLDELEWFHHGQQLGVWFWRNAVWWNPDAGVSPEEREWLEEKYPGWNANHGKKWDVITKNAQEGKTEKLGPQTLPMICNTCHLPIVRPSDPQKNHIHPYVSEVDGRKYSFCSEPCKWIFDTQPGRYDSFESIVDRMVGGQIQPPTPAGAISYMGLTQKTMGQDADNFAWAKGIKV